MSNYGPSASRRGIAPLLIVLFIALGIGGGVVATKAVEGKLSPPTADQKQRVSSLGALFGPSGDLISSAFMGIWELLATPTGVIAGTTGAVAVVQSKKKKKAETDKAKTDKALSALWNVLPDVPGPEDKLPPSILSTIHAIDAEATASAAVH